MIGRGKKVRSFADCAGGDGGGNDDLAPKQIARACLLPRAANVNKVLAKSTGGAQQSDPIALFPYEIPTSPPKTIPSGKLFINNFKLYSFAGRNN